MDTASTPFPLRLYFGGTCLGQEENAGIGRDSGPGMEPIVPNGHESGTEQTRTNSSSFLIHLENKSQWVELTPVKMFSSFYY